jgi:hypothetical protein
VEEGKRRRGGGFAPRVDEMVFPFSDLDILGGNFNT